MAKDSRVTFEGTDTVPTKPNKAKRGGGGGGGGLNHHHHHHQHAMRTERQISYEDAENCVNEMSESFPALSKLRAHKLMRQVSTSFNSRTIKVALILSVILNLLLAIPFGIFFGFWMSQKSSESNVLPYGSASQVIPPSSSVSSTSLLTSSSSSSSTGDAAGLAIMKSCFCCSDLDSELRSRVKVRSPDGVLCCTDEGDVRPVKAGPNLCLTFPYFLLRFMGGNSDLAKAICREDAPGGTGMEKREASWAHLMLNVEETKMNVKRWRGKAQAAENPLEWLVYDEAHRTYLGEGVKYERGQLTIKHPGVYHVYSQVTFSTLENPLPDDIQERMIVHSIIRKSRNVNKTLLFSQVTVVPHEIQATNLEGTFQLLEGDSLSVYISYPTYLKSREAANVFGLFPLL